MSAPPGEPQSRSAERPIDPGALKRRLTALRAQEEEESALDPKLELPLLTAATLVEFDPVEMLQICGVPVDTDTLEKLFRHTTGATRSDRVYTTESRRRSGLWRLPLAERRRVLAGAGGVTALRTARQRTTGPSLLVQRMADRVLQGDSPALAGLSISELAALVEVRAWYEGIVPGLPDEADLRRRIAMAQLVEPMRRLVGHHFVGRQRELARLTDYVSLLGAQKVFGSDLLGQGVRYLRSVRRTLIDNPPLFIAGPGGVGKSSLLARFILNHVDAPQGAGMPFVMLDFDRAQIEARKPVSLLVAALHQLRVQFPAHEAEMSRMAAHLVEQMRSAGGDVSKVDSLQGRLVEDFARQIDEMVWQGDDSTPLLWVLDTFEEPQRLGESTVGPLWHLMNLLQQHLPRLRLVICGRVAPRGFAWDEVELSEFDDESAMAYLRHRFNGSGGADPVDEKTLAQVIKVVGRSPLALRLGARLLIEKDYQLLSMKLRSDRIQAILFHRVLEHVRVDPRLDSRQGPMVVGPQECKKLEEELQRLVFPGLVVRRITPGVIEHVLAQPCGVKIRDADHAERLFRALAQQVDIVAPDEDDGLGPSLLHLTNVRRMMLRGLEQQAGAELVARIDRLAVTYHAKIATLANCGEEIYHRLRLDQPKDTIRGRWEAGLERYLGSAIDEIPSLQKRILLAELLGITLDAESLKDAEQDDWERQTALRAGEYLRAGHPAGALKVLSERKERMSSSPLLRLEAQALQQASEFGAAATLALRAVEEAAEVGDFVSAADAALLLSQAEEAIGRLDEASTYARQAYTWGVDRGDRLLQLRGLTAGLRIDRKRGGDRVAQEAAEREIRLTLTGAARRGLRSQPAVVRELLAELGGRDERMLRLGLEVLGMDLSSESQATRLAESIVAWTLSGMPEDVVLDIAKTHGVLPDTRKTPPYKRDWMQWLWSSTSSEIGRLVLALLKTSPPDPSVAAQLADLFRTEVDRRITRGHRNRAV